MLTQILIFLLMVDAGYVAYGQVTRGNVWPFICAYWIILTVKNALDFARVCDDRLRQATRGKRTV